jgi:hypothetical protein
MAAEFDASEFVDREFENAQRSFRGGTAVTAMADDAGRAPTRDEVESKVGDLQSKLAELKRAQTDLERERASLEETRRRQHEYTAGRQEVIHSLTRGVGLLEEAEFASRRDAEQMAKTLNEMREALTKVQVLNEGEWTKDNFQVELTRALTAVESARMEWNSARLKWPLLSGEAAQAANAEEAEEKPKTLADKTFLELSVMGLALTWPLVLGVLALVVALLVRR